MIERIGVIGAGGWGTALSILLGEKGFPVTLWAYEKETCENIVRMRENPVFLPGANIPQNISPTNSIEEACRGKDLIISVSPSHVVRSIMGKAAQFLDETTIILSASKGIENDTLLTMSGVLREVLPERLRTKIAVVSGPSFAREVALHAPTAVVVSSENEVVAGAVQEALSTPNLRVYTNPDIVGIELGGALKNVIAIAAGVSDGLGLGLNTRAALITRGLAEISRLGVKIGANPLTFAGLAGMGDLVLTCTGDLSRNRTVGLKLGRGKTLAEILAEMKMVAEGIKTSRAARELGRRHGVEMPITEQVYLLLYENKPAKQAVVELMSRELKTELG